MTTSFNDSMRDELEYVGAASSGEALNFSALGTFDHGDSCGQQLQHPAASVGSSRGDGSVRNERLPINSSHQIQMDASMIMCSPGKLQDSRGQGQSQQPLTPTRMNTSPLSSVSKDDSSSDGTPFPLNTSSIFRPRQGGGVKGYHRQQHRRPDVSTRQKMIDQYSNNASRQVEGQRSTGYYDHQEAQKHHGGARQVSVSDYRQPVMTSSFDSFGSSRYSRNLAHIDSFMDGKKSFTSFDGNDRRYDHHRNDDRQDSSCMYRYGGAPSQESRNDARVDESVSPATRNTTLAIPRTQTYPDAASCYPLLRTRAKLFTSFSFLLPGFKMYVVKVVNENRSGWNGHRPFQTTRQEVVAKRRLKSATLAFGGMSPRSLKRNSSPSKYLDDDQLHKADYEKGLPMRYFDNNLRLSWDVEENPPVGGSPSSTDVSSKHPKNDKKEEKEYTYKALKNELFHDADAKKENIPDDRPNDDDGDDSGNISKVSETPKMKYRCKLCGQPKQNHTCPYLQELQRSIGTMSYPALNAFQCSEPGEVAPALSSMNNFTDLEEDDPDVSTASESDKNVVTPDLGKSKKRRLQSNISTIAYGLTGKKRRVCNNNRENNQNYRGDESLMLPTMEIKPEQYRTVSPRAVNNPGAFEYTALPLTFRQRKGMSDTLFDLCQEVSGLTEECSEVLHMARETDMWDLAVAELIVQTLVMLYCPANDIVLEGLTRYLLTMGISC